MSETAEDRRDGAPDDAGNGETPARGPRTPEEEIAALSEENAGLLDRLKRLQAEFENYRKRIAREKALWTERALEELLLDLLPVLDSFDRALDASGGADGDALLEGMKLVKRQLAGVLASRDVEPIEALGREFDPRWHEAFMTRPPAAGEAPGTVVEEIVRGFRIGERTLRATRGVVAAEDASEADAAPGTEEE